jgi:Enoyl-(Acyl carrier protein) reductase
MNKFALGLHPIGRFGTPMEVSEAVVWMCSDRASFMTGQSLVLDGGFLAGPDSPHQPHVVDTAPDETDSLPLPAPAARSDLRFSRF